MWSNLVLTPYFLHRMELRKLEHEIPKNSDIEKWAYEPSDIRLFVLLLKYLDDLYVSRPFGFDMCFLI